MAPARSIQCIKRPPSSAPKGLASLGRTSSAISDCDSLTTRGFNELVSFIFRKIRCRLTVCYLARPRPPRLQKALGHLLNTRIRMRGQPAIANNTEFEMTVTTRLMVLLTDICQADARFVIARHCEPHRIPLAFSRQPRTIAGISQIALLKFAGC